MMMNVVRFLSICVLAMVAGIGHAAEPGEAEQRERIRQERLAVEARHAEREQACRGKFVVTPCLEKARTEKLDAMSVLRQREISLDEAGRRRRSLEQARRVGAKEEAVEQQSKLAGAPEGPQSPRVRSPKAPHVSLLPKAGASSSGADRRGAEEQSRQAHDARLREIQAHREAVEKRRAEKAANRTAKPLPLPEDAR